MKKHLLLISSMATITFQSHAGITSFISNSFYSAYYSMLSNENLVQKTKTLKAQAEEALATTAQAYSSAYELLENNDALNKYLSEKISTETYGKYPHVSYVEKLATAESTLKGYEEKLDILIQKIQKRNELMLDTDIQELIENAENCTCDLNFLRDSLTALRDYVAALPAYSTEFYERLDNQRIQSEREDRREERENAWHQSINWDKNSKDSATTTAPAKDDSYSNSLGWEFSGPEGIDLSTFV